MPIQEAKLRYTLTTGISYGGIGGVVSVIDEFESAKTCGYTWSEWNKLEYDEKVERIALCRASHLIEMHSNDASQAYSEREMKMRNNKGKM